MMQVPTILLDNNQAFCWMNVGVVNFCWGLKHLLGTRNPNLVLPIPDQGLEVAFRAWSNLTEPTLISANSFSQVYMNFIGAQRQSAEQRNRARFESPETFFRYNCPKF